MNPWSTYIYLFFLNECKGMNDSFFQMVFQFHRFLALEKKMEWERLFWVDEQAIVAKDVEIDNILRTLIHHELIHSTYEANETGLLYLDEMKETNPKVFELLKEFLEKYYHHTFETKNCFLKGYSFPVACHLCQERVCINNKMTMKDFGHLLNFKGFKNPYKKREYKTPHF